MKLAIPFLFVIASFLLIGCGSPDSDVKQDLGAKAPDAPKYSQEQITNLREAFKNGRKAR